MKPPSLQGLFRGAGLGACVMIGLPLLLDMWLGGPAGALKDAGIPLPPEPARAQRVWAVLMGFWVVAVLAFGICFWLCTRPGFAERHRRLKVILLGLQTAVGTFVWTDFLVITAAEIPFVLSGRRALAWFAVQSALVTAHAWSFSDTAQFEVLPRTSHLPRQLAVVLTIVASLTFHAVFFCVGFIAATETRRRREMARLNADLEATRLLLAESSRLAERLHIARELHDGIGHALALLNVKLELAQQQVSRARAERADPTVSDPASGGAAADDAVREARAATKELFRQVRAIVGQLREDRPLDLPRALEQLVAGVSEPRIELRLPAPLPALDPARAHALFRCVQEIVTNAVRHAQARVLRIEVTAPAAQGDVDVVLDAHDDGRGARRLAPGNGLRGLRERVEGLGGTVTFETTPARGFRVRAALPARAASEPAA